VKKTEQTVRKRLEAQHSCAHETRMNIDNRSISLKAFDAQMSESKNNTSDAHGRQNRKSYNHYCDKEMCEYQQYKSTN
jgi:hypothetical protein